MFQVIALMGKASIFLQCRARVGVGSEAASLPAACCSLFEWLSAPHLTHLRR
jgi:hypothetical protein